MFHYAKKASADLEITRIRTIRDDDGRLLAYVHELSPEGFIITSADTEVRAILGFSFKGKFPFIDTKDNALLHLLKWDVKARLKALEDSDQTTKSLSKANMTGWNSYGTSAYKALYKAAATQEWGPLVKTNWDQWDYYNRKVPYRYAYDSSSFPSRRPVGCVATAMSQIINYWQYPLSLYFDSDDSYKKNGIDIDADAVAYGFPTFSELNSALSTIDYITAEEEALLDPDLDIDKINEIAYLNFAAGIKLKTEYGIDVSSVNMFAKTAPAFKNGFLYGSAERVLLPDWSKKKTKVIENIKREMPVQIGIHDLPHLASGHSIIIDGYRESGDFFHLNMGWYDISGDTWYNLPYITSPPSLLPYNVITMLLYDILPFQGWHQYGADEKNTFHSIYNAPTENIITNKWQVSPLADYKFSGLVVGYGAKIYASLDPNKMNQGYNPELWIINQYGDVEETYSITSEDGSISYPVQNSKGEVFVAGWDGGIYKLDTVTKNLIKIYLNPSGLGFNTFKVDSDDYLYANTDTELISLTSDGTWRWTFTTPSGEMIYRGQPSIDVSKDNVYIGYYNSTAKTSYLGAINRLNGSLRYQKTVTNVENSTRMTGVPSIGSDGTVYVGIRYNLYALTPGSTTFSEKWVKDTNSVIEEAPVIKEGGLFSSDTLYISDWKQISGIWYPFIGAYDSSNGTNKWEVTIPKNSDYDSIMQPYVANNDVVVFSVLREKTGSDEFELYAYKDNGTSATHLWSKAFGTNSGSDVAFGPSETLYILPVSAAGGMIYAASEGSVGNPDEGSMGYTDNTAPDAPTNPLPLDGSVEQPTDLTLSWSAFDSDGHELTYDVFVNALISDGEASFVPVATQITTTTYNLTGLTQGVRYLWQVVATDGQSISESPEWSFTTVNDPPSVVTVTPASESTNIAVNTAITAEFSESMDASTINTSTFVLNNGVTGTVSYDHDTKIATFTPYSDLAYSTTYTATITTGVKDLLGAGMAADHTWSFTTRDESDTTPPEVISTYPLNNETGIPVNTTITATFSEDMDASSINSATFTLYEDGSNIAGTVAYTGTTATFTPSYDLDYYTIYNVTITTGVKDLAGNYMTRDYSWSFTSGDEPDIHPPAVNSTNPSNGSTNVLVDTFISGTFSEEMDASTITTNTFTVSAGGSRVAGTVTYNGTTAAFTPSNDLSYSTTYTATITTGVKDLAGNNMVSDYNWNFTTESKYASERMSDESSCFIATVAYGSPIHPYVDTLRDFRDKYLQSSKLGRELVDLYYKYSPSVANVIARSKPLKVLVRIHLTPIIVLSYSMVYLGPIVTGGVLLCILVLPIFIIYVSRRR